MGIIEDEKWWFFIKVDLRDCDMIQRASKTHSIKIKIKPDSRGKLGGLFVGIANSFKGEKNINNFITTIIKKMKK